MSLHIALLFVLAAIIILFLLQCILYFKLKIDAAYVIGFCLYFDMFGYFYKQVFPGNALFLLLAIPFVPAVIAWFSREREAHVLLKDQGVWLWGIWFFYGLASLVWTVPGSAGLNKLVILAVHAVIPGLYAYIIYKKYRRFSWTVLALFGFAFALVHLLFGEYSEMYPGRLSLPNSNPIFNARMSLITITVCIWGKRIPWPIRIITIAVAGASAFATQSRGPIVAFVIANGLAVAYILYGKYKRGELRYLRRYVAGMLFVLCIGGLVAAHYADELQTLVSTSRFTIFFDRSQLVGDANYIGRLDLQSKAMDQWSAHPFMGAGIGSVTPPLAHDFPHNVVLEIASELGIIGFGLWFLAYVFSLVSARHSLALAVLLLQTLGTALLSGDMGFNFEYLLLALLACALAPGKDKEVSQDHAQNYVHTHRS
ncbi:O-antigen ligase family protein [Paenibacillus lutimineralis]|uniref:O-antigen ligase domain-containing protein n=1 Tax=Paenibacillus lutimineralis TaxID=2707005 RepID=A0A3Q9ICI9_9BACL|nr:O-antigen ligase family protein [Paenibacillus lutimineralis]AZS17739.1 O-antigen ligase domain-containing protein [Paenibacillus lutimineralis]